MFPKFAIVNFVVTDRLTSFQVGVLRCHHFTWTKDPISRPVINPFSEWRREKLGFWTFFVKRKIPPCFWPFCVISMILSIMITWIGYHNWQNHQKSSLTQNWPNFMKFVVLRYFGPIWWRSSTSLLDRHQIKVQNIAKVTNFHDKNTNFMFFFEIKNINRNL